VIRQRFRNLTRCNDHEEITYYLEFHGYNLDEAVNAYRDDKAWEEMHSARRVVSTLTNRLEDIPIPSFALLENCLEPTTLSGCWV